MTDVNSQNKPQAKVAGLSFSSYFKWKNFAFVLLCMCLHGSLTGCSASKERNPEHVAQIQKIDDYIKKSCPLTDSTGGQQDVILATLYFNSYQSSLSPSQKQILNHVLQLNQSCDNKLLIIGHSSNFENSFGAIKAAKISYNRALEVYKYLKPHFKKDKLLMLFCGNTRLKFVEAMHEPTTTIQPTLKAESRYGNKNLKSVDKVTRNPMSTFGNQRVEVVFLANGTHVQNLACLRDLK